ncbi:hypothetical protein [Longimicrobium sp.]|uniref:hypothetical protein n=1 Tax=Longimicrobium sp. TaxID=2029185 RepID=UPI002BDE5B7C|nr:hypothetical protein [Longimicrobium sp.]HSU16943.1 hypothetical protein [Longimicrobium sp.]
MRKLRLEPEDLAVESFDTRGTGLDESGTVYGNAVTTPCSCRGTSCLATACVDANGCIDPTCRAIQ